MSSGWNRLWLSRISHIWEKRPGWLQRGTLRGLPFKRFARKPPKGNSASRPRRLPRIPKAWLGLPGSDNQALLEKIGESRFEERNRGRGRCLKPAHSCKSELWDLSSNLFALCHKFKILDLDEILCESQFHLNLVNHISIWIQRSETLNLYFNLNKDLL